MKKIMKTVIDLSDKNNLGHYVDITELNVKHPNGVYGQYAYLYSTNTTWCWDQVGLAWINSGA